MKNAGAMKKSDKYGDQILVRVSAISNRLDVQTTAYQ